jgi:hypothetical protein
METTIIRGLLVLDSESVVQSLCNPVVNFDRIPTHGPNPEADGFGKLRIPHELIDLRSLQSDFFLDFRAAQNAAIDRYGERGSLGGHCDHSLTLHGVVRDVV